MSEPVRALIVDDEPLARRGVRLHLGDVGGYSIVGEAASGREAIALIKQLKPDVVFLDVQMPGIDGFGVVAALGETTMPAIVFITGHDIYAVRAFEMQAVDYILKPIDPVRFARTAIRVRDEFWSNRRVPRLMLRDGHRALFVSARDISWVRADGDYIWVHVGSKQYMLRGSLTELQREFSPLGFLRIHRSLLVNGSRIQGVRPYGDRRRAILLDNGTRLIASRAFRGEIDQFLAASSNVKEVERGDLGIAR